MNVLFGTFSTSVEDMNEKLYERIALIVCSMLLQKSVEQSNSIVRFTLLEYDERRICSGNFFLESKTSTLLSVSINKTLQLAKSTY